MNYLKMSARENAKMTRFGSLKVFACSEETSIKKM